jgi:hypothetical protein
VVGFDLSGSELRHLRQVHLVYAWCFVLVGDVVWVRRVKSVFEIESMVVLVLEKVSSIQGAGEQGICMYKRESSSADAAPRVPMLSHPAGS